METMKIMLPISKMETESTKRTKMKTMMIKLLRSTNMLRSREEASISIQLKSLTRSSLLIRKEGLISRMQRTIALRPRSRDREPLVHTTSLRKNINFPGLLLETHSFITKGLNLTLPLRLLKEAISRLAALYMDPRCGAIFGRLFRIFAKTTQIIRLFKMEVKSILPLAPMEEEFQSL